MKKNSFQPDWTLVAGSDSSPDRIAEDRAMVDIGDIDTHRWDQAALATLRKAVEASGEIIFLTDREGLITYVNPEFTRLYGHTAEEVVGRTTPRILKSGRMAAQEYESFWKALLNKQVITREFVNRCKDGHLVTVEGSANPILDDRGEICGFLAIQRDITDRVAAEQRSRQQNKEQAALYAITTAINQSLNLDQILDVALDEVLQLDMFAGAAKGMIFRLVEESGKLLLISHRGAPMDHPCRMRPLKLGECLCGLAVQTRQVVISEDCFNDSRHSRLWPTMPKHKDICLPLQVHGQALGVMNVRLPVSHQIANHDVKLLKAAADQISVAIENARLFGELREQHNRLRALNARLAEIEETEKQLMAQELHDQVGQKLTALGINMNILRGEFARMGMQKFVTLLDESQELVEQIALIIRGVMADLRPPMLDDLGLVESLRWYSDLFAARTGIDVSVRSSPSSIELPHQTEIALFRITQEAFTNVIKHAQATKIDLILNSDGSDVRLIISDNGVGSRMEPTGDTIGGRGWGLQIMAERAEAVGGRCWMEANPSQIGMQVVAEIPR